VLPAEAVDILPDDVSEADRRSAFGLNVIPCTITRLQVVGHIMQMIVTLENGKKINVEGHVDKYRDRLKAGAAAFVAWKPSGATVIDR